MSKFPYSRVELQSPSDIFDERFVIAFVVECVDDLERNNDLKKLLLTAPLRMRAGQNLAMPSLVWKSLQMEFDEDEIPTADEDALILDIYLKNLDAIQESLIEEIAVLDEEKKANLTLSINEAFAILHNLKSSNPQISVNKIIWHGTLENRTSGGDIETANNIELLPDGSYYYGEVNHPKAKEISDNSVKEGKGVLTCANGDRYEGSYNNREQTGEGTLTYNPDNPRTTVEDVTAMQLANELNNYCIIS